MTSNELDWQQPWSLQDVADFLAVGSESLRGQGARMVTGIAQDSRQVRPGDIFAAFLGAEHHGGAFVVEAAARGAVAVVSDRATEVLPTLVVTSPRTVLGPLAAQILSPSLNEARCVRSDGNQWQDRHHIHVGGCIGIRRAAPRPRKRCVCV